MKDYFIGLTGLLTIGTAIAIPLFCAGFGLGFGFGIGFGLAS